MALPEPSSPDGTAADFRLLGQIEGGKIRVRIGIMAIGMLRRWRQDKWRGGRTVFPTPAHLRHQPIVTVTIWPVAACGVRG